MEDVGNRRRSTRPCAYYLQGKCNRPNCNFSHDIPAANHTNGTSDSQSSQTTSIATPSDGDPAGEAPHPYKSAYKTKLCRFYVRGRCTAGDSCRWSHDVDATEEEESPEPPRGGYKLVPKAYRTLPCARFQAGHCYYGDECNFIHATPSTSAVSTPAVGPPRTIGPSPPQLTQKSHSTHHSPAISPLNAPAIRQSINGSVAPSAVGATLSAPTRPRELPPPPSQGHYTNVNWSVGTPGTPAKGTPVFASSPLIPAAGDWAPPISRSNSLQPNPESAPTNGNPNLGLPPSQMRSPFLLTFGQIGPNGVNSATNSPRGLGLNGADLAATGEVTPSTSLNGASTSGFGSLPTTGSALGTTGISVPRLRSRLSSAVDVETEEHVDVNIDGETEPDFPSINYSDLNDLVTEPDDSKTSEEPPYSGRPLDPSAHRLVGDVNGVNGYTNGFNGPPTYGHPNGAPYESDWGQALSMLHGHQAPPPFQPHHTGMSNGYSNGYQDFRNGYKSRPCKYYVAGSRCPSGQNCTFIHDPDALNRTRVGFSPPPRTVADPKHPLYRTRECKYHLAGRCHQEGQCDFKHTGPPGQGREYENWEGFSIQVREPEVLPDERPTYRSRPCKWFLKGNCFHGDNCTYLHDLSYLRPPCHFFRNGTGHCMAGDSCRFSHDIVPDNDEDDQQQGDEYDNQQEAVKAEQPSIPVPEVVHEVYAERQTDEFNEPYFGGINGDHLSVAGPRMELVVSEGEEEEEDDDVVVLKPSVSKSRFDADNKDVEKLFASLSVANVA